MEYKLIELVVFIIPVISFLIGAYQKIFNSERAAIEFIDFRNKYGAKIQMLKKPRVFLAYGCFIVSPLYISTGIIWSVFGVILLLGSIAFLLFSDGQTATPDLCSTEFEKFIVKRKKGVFIGGSIISLWIVSWFISWS